jgi:hypothetical protein
MANIDLIYFNAGGGHRAAAEALREVMVGEGSPWRVRLLNLFEMLDPQHLFRRVVGMPPEDYYNRRLARGWTFGMAQELKLPFVWPTRGSYNGCSSIGCSRRQTWRCRWCRTSTWRFHTACRPRDPGCRSSRC